jgi:hypothetical protein
VASPSIGITPTERWTFDAGVYQEKITGIQPRPPWTHPNMSLLTGPQKIRVGRANTDCVDTSPLLDKQGIKKVQKIVGSILYYARTVDMTVLMALSSIAVEQTRATTQTMGRCIQLLDYLASNSEAKIRYYASDMVMNIHSDASYLSETKARSRAC